MPEILKHKQYVVSEIKATDDESGIVTAVINTLAIDRDKEVVLPKGAMLDEYMKNPVVLWAHNSSEPPIAKAVYVDKRRKQIIAKIKFADTEFAQDIYKLYKGGFMKAFSVGFIPKKGHMPSPEEIKARPDLAECRYIIDKWEMYEFSAVPVPANPEALAQAVKSKSIDIHQETADLLIKDFTEEEDDLEQEVYFDPTEVKDLNISDAFELNDYYCLVGDQSKYTCYRLVKNSFYADDRPIDTLFGIEKGKAEPVAYVFTDWTEEEINSVITNECKQMMGEGKLFKGKIAIEYKEVTPIEGVVEAVVEPIVKVSPVIDITPVASKIEVKAIAKPVIDVAKIIEVNVIEACKRKKGIVYG